ncbi:MAG: GNAT family N-acetyltransferase [Actinomycetota bacterium]
MDATIRVARDDDADRIARIHTADGGEAELIGGIGAAISEGRCVVAATGDRVVGFVVLARQHFFGRDFVVLLAVDRERRRAGLGRALMRASVEAASTGRVFSSTNESNTPMRALFAAEGWSVSGTLDGLDPGDPEIVFFVDRTRTQQRRPAPT